MSRLEVVTAMGVALRDKYDFSSDEDFTRWAAQACKAADALMAMADKTNPAVVPDAKKKVVAQ